MSQEPPIVVVGAGLAGSMMALLLGARGLPIVVCESRPDWRTQNSEAKATGGAFGQLTDARARSINLALSHRGMAALERVGILDRVRPALIPMEGRAVHTGDGRVTLQPYDHEAHQAIYSVSRTGLNDLVLAELAKLKNVQVLFNHKLRSISEDGRAEFFVVGGEGGGGGGGGGGGDGGAARKTVTFQARFVVGADGAFSETRRWMMRHARINFSQYYIPHGYKELTIPPAKDGGFALPSPHALHIWPREGFMLIALPNPDHTFTCTLFAPFEGPEGLDALKTDEQVLAYFRKHFADAVPLMPDLLGDFKRSPSSSLVTVRCDPWNFKDKIFLVGDAAHAVVPFYGQGMNAAFEDCVVFDEIWAKHEQAGGGRVASHGAVIDEFNRVRQPSGPALADLSLNNYVEMRSLTAKPWFAAKRRIDALLHHVAPTMWIPLYTMVSFSRIPYHEAARRAERQDRILARALALIGAGAVAATGVFLARNGAFDKVGDAVKGLLSRGGAGGSGGK
jgi:kynurenine 3-monooxygenase